MDQQDTIAQAPFPPLAFIAESIDVSLRIRPRDNRYELEIIALDQVLKSPIDLTQHDLSKLSTDLHEELRKLSVDNEDIDYHVGGDSADILRPLAEAGHFAYKGIFCESARAALERIFEMHPDSSIQIVSEDFFLPWELLYSRTLSESVNAESFWGMQHVISRIIVRDTNDEVFVAPLISTNGIPKLGLFSNKVLASVVAKEIPFFEHLRNEGKISLFHLRVLNPNVRIQELDFYRQFWTNRFNISHFACHAFHNDQSPQNSCIELSDTFSISIRDMVVYDILIEGHPLVVLNACETGNQNPLYTYNFAASFLKHGARGVVATECAVPDKFAADFTEQLYDQLLAGTSLGQSLLAVRRYFVNQFSNPTGLLYSLYASPSIRLDINKEPDVL